MEGEGERTQKISYMSKTPKRRKAVKNESSFSIARVVVARHKARVFDRMYGLPRGM